MSKSSGNVKKVERKDVYELASSKVVEESVTMAEQSLNSHHKLVKFIFKSASIVGLIATIFLGIYGYQIGIFSSLENMNLFILRFGYWGPLIFVMIQIIQVVIPIIPGGISCLAGVIIFGPFYGFVYNYLGIAVGSVINFLLARRYGKAFVLSVISRNTYDRYNSWLQKGVHFDKLFAIAIFMPVAPDDFLCSLAGLTKMSFKKFTSIILVCKPPSILAYSLGLTVVSQWLTHLL